MKCIRCGKCCNTVILALHNTPLSNDKQELGRWVQYHGLQPVKIFNGKENVLAVKIQSKCEHLETKDGLFYNCKIYDKRPQICKDHWCQEHNMQEFAARVVKELVKEGECIAT